MYSVDRGQLSGRQVSASAPPPWTPFKDVTDTLSLASDKMREAAKIISPMLGNKARRAFLNSRYMVFVETGPGPGSGPDKEWAYLSVRRVDRQAVHDWRDLQRVKNELVGPEREAFELYPAESRLCDTANQYWLFVVPEGEQIPVGFRQRLVIEESGDGTVQRPWSNEDRPADVKTVDQALSELKSD